jgi:simple sugar transport system ATP-binding protein
MAANTLLRMEGITKTYPGVLANDCISFDVVEGEIHALLGENGAGKTTLMRILYGMSTPDTGTLYWRGQPVHISSSHRAIELGIGMVHQHFMLIPEFSVIENVVLGLHTGRSPLLDLQSAARRLEELSIRYGLHVEPWAMVKDLSTGERQRVEIVKALYRGAHLFVLDEPTAVLTPGEADDLFVVLDALRAQGHAVIFISHKLDEVMRISNRVTVLRRGCVVATVLTCDTTKEELATLMVGRPVVLRVERQPHQPGKFVIELDRVNVTTEDNRHQVHDVSLSVRAGEIVALTGVAGNGQRSLVEALFGLRPVTSGQILVLGRDVRDCGPRDLVRLNLGRIPEDRQTMGLAMPLSVRENLALEVFREGQYCRAGFLKQNSITQLAKRLGTEYDIRMPSAQVPASTLSGGNQQKVILARVMHRLPLAVVAADPTRGLDVGATEFVYQQLLAARDRGVAILLFSTDLEEVLCLSDRIAVIHKGEIMGVMPTEEAQETQLGLMMAGTRLENLPEELKPRSFFVDCSSRG